MTDDYQFGTERDAQSGGLGPAWRRYLLAGVYNGDFAEAPDAPGSDIAATNPLPWWTFAHASGTSVRAASVIDTDSASGRVLRFSLPDGAAGAHAYIEQIVPVNGSRGRSWAYSLLATVAVKSGDATNELRIEMQFLKADGTTTGAATSATAAMSTILTPEDVAATAVVPNNAYLLRIRVGFAGGAGATAGTMNLSEVRVLAGPSRLVWAESVAPASNGYGMAEQRQGVLYVEPDAGGVGYTALVGGRIAVPAAAMTLLATTQISPEAEVQPITATAPRTMTSTPTVVDSADGAMLTLVNVGTNAITFQDEGTLGGSNLRLSTTTVALGQRDSLRLMYLTDAWVELGRTNVL